VIALGISMARGGDIIELGKALEKASAAIRADLPVGLELHQFQNQAKVVSGSVNEFVGTLVEAILIVLGVSFVALGLHFKPLRLDWRPGLVVAITIPLVLAITFVVMYYAHVGLHKISLGSLIIALGLLVDDAIIAVEMMVRKLEEGFDKARAATFAYEATAMPMLTGTLITAVGFLPIGLAQSTVGEYTFAIFAVTAGGAGDLLAGLGLLRALPRHPAARGAAQGRQPRAAARAVRHAVLRRFAPSSPGACATAGRRSARPSPRSSSASPAWARCSSSSSPTRAGSRCWSTSGIRKGTRSPPTRR
jgi:Cu/Ag efflux pump CusA